MQGVIDKPVKQNATAQRSHQNPEREPRLAPLEEIRDPQSVGIGACWCPGIGQEVVTTTTFPILLGKC